MDRSRYRFISWIGARILQAREMLKLETILHGVSDTNVPTAFDLNAVYKDGATFNITPVITPNSTTVTLTPTDNTKPMLVFVRGRFEILKTTEAPPITLTAGQTNLYLNWQVVVRTNVDDSQLVDTVTGAPTAQMGELVLQVSATDDSVRAAYVTEFEKNTAVTILYTFATSGNTLRFVSETSVQPQALASNTAGGVVFLTTGSSAGFAASSDDSRLSDLRTPLAGSVCDSKVRTPVPDGSGNYAIGTDIGGISNAKIVHAPTHQTGEAAVESIRATANDAEAKVAGHINQPLGTGVHPMPTAAQVGAAPLSHTTLALGSTGSHPPVVNANSSGFQLIRDAGAGLGQGDPAYAVLKSGVLQTGLMHNGDVFSLAANSRNAAPLVEAGDTLTTGPLGYISAIANVLADHVNKTSHKNPHGLACADIQAVPLSAFTQSLTANGYISLPGGLIVQWGRIASMGTGSAGSFSQSVVFGSTSANSAGTRSFPNACFTVVASTVGTSGFDRITYVDAISKAGFTLRNNGSGAGATWIAVGY